MITHIYNNTEYSYNDLNGPNRLSDYITRGTDWEFLGQVFQKYHSDGALYKKYKYVYTIKSDSIYMPRYDVRCEEFFYNYNNLTNKYVSLDATTIGINPEVNFLEPKTVWRYRYNPFGEREQKRMYQSPLGDTNEEFYPWVYYMLGIDNRQYATYYGVQSNDNGVLSDDNWSQIARLDPGRPMTFFYPAEYNVYGNEMAPRITYRYVDDEWQKQFKFYDYLGSLRFTMKADGTLLNFKQYAAFGETTHDTLGVTRQSYIGKEKDVENGLGDHGVRKYDYETGRFNSIDPLWEKYFGWTSYHYTRNNPICRVDFNGKDDGQFGSWMQVGPIQQQILGEKNVKTYQDVVKYSDKPENKELVNTWAEIGIMGLTGIGTEAALATKVATKYLSKAGNLLKGLLGFGDEAEYGVQLTKHGAECIAGAAATRGGVLSMEEVGAIRSLVQKPIIQGDGAKVFIHEVSPGRFSGFIENQNTGKLITTMNNWSKKSINKMGKNHGWSVE